MIENYLIRGLLIGLIFGVPAGAIGALTIQRTITYGFTAGFVTGIGSSVGDVLYACIGICGLTMIVEFISDYQLIISLIGGVLIFSMGVTLLKKQEEVQAYQMEKKSLGAFFSQSFLIAITNPATIFSFFVAFTSLGIPDRLSTSQGLQLILGIFLGTGLWWGGLSAVVHHLRKRISPAIHRKLNLLLAICLFLFAGIVIIRAFISM